MVDGVIPLSSVENEALYDLLRGNGCALPFSDISPLLEKNRRNIAAYLEAPSIDFYVFFSMRTSQQLADAVDFSKSLVGYDVFSPMNVVSDSQADQGDLEIRMLGKARGAVGIISEETFGWITEINSLRARGIPPILVVNDPKKYGMFHERHVFRTFPGATDNSTVLVTGKRENVYGVQRSFSEQRTIAPNSKVGMHVIKSDQQHDWKQKLNNCLRSATGVPRVYERMRPAQYLEGGVLQYACRNCHATLYEENVWSPSSRRREKNENRTVILSEEQPRQLKEFD